MFFGCLRAKKKSSDKVSDKEKPQDACRGLERRKVAVLEDSQIEVFSSNPTVYGDSVVPMSNKLERPNARIQTDRVLLIEDTKMLYKAFMHAFKRKFPGALLDHAITAEQASVLLQSNYYTSIVVDHLLPDGTGVAVIEEFIKQANYLPKIVFSSATPALCIEARDEAQLGCFEVCDKLYSEDTIELLLSQAKTYEVPFDLTYS